MIQERDLSMKLRQFFGILRKVSGIDRVEMVSDLSKRALSVVDRCVNPIYKKGVDGKVKTDSSGMPILKKPYSPYDYIIFKDSEDNYYIMHPDDEDENYLPFERRDIVMS